MSIIDNKDTLLYYLNKKIDNRNKGIKFIPNSKRKYKLDRNKQKKSQHLISKAQSPNESNGGEIEQSFKFSSSSPSHEINSSPSGGCVITDPHPINRNPLSLDYGKPISTPGISLPNPIPESIEPAKTLETKKPEPKTLLKDSMSPAQKAFFCYCAHIARGDPKFSYFYEEHGIQMSWKDIELYVKDHPEEFNLKELEKAKSKAFGHWFRNGADLVESGGKRHAQAVVGVWHEIMENLFRDEYGWGREKPQELIVRTAADEILDQMRSKRIQKAVEVEIE